MIIVGTHDMTRTLYCADKILHVPTQILGKMAALNCKNTPNFSLAQLARIQFCIPNVGKWSCNTFSFTSQLVYTISFVIN